jgi:hypothetical protein
MRRMLNLALFAVGSLVVLIGLVWVYPIESPG